MEDNELRIVQQLEHIISNLKSGATNQNMAQKSLEQAQELVQGHTQSGRVAERLDRLERLARTFIEPQKQTERCRQLQEDIRCMDRVTPKQLARALQSNDFTPDTRLGYEESRQFQNLMRTPIRQLRERYDNTASFDPQRYQTLHEELQRLRDSIPRSVSSVVRSITRMIDAISDTIDFLEGSRRVDVFIKEIRDTETRQIDDWNLRDLKQRFMDDAYVKSNPNDPRIREGIDLLDHLIAKERMYQKITELPDQVLNHLGRNEIADAIEAINHGLEQSIEWKLLELSPVRMAAEHIVNYLHEQFRAYQSKPEATSVKEREERLEAMELIGRRLNRLPEDIRKDYMEFSTECSKATNIESLKFQEAQAEEVKYAFRDVDISHLDSYIRDHRNTMNQPIKDWIDSVEKLSTAYNQLAQLEDNIDNELVDYLKNAPGEFGQARSSLQAAELADRHLQFCHRLDEINDAVESETMDLDRTLKELNDFQKMFPKWHRIKHSKCRICDREKILKIKHLSDVLDYDKLSTAIATAKGITEGKYREEIERELQLLANFSRELNRIRTVLGQFNGIMTMPAREAAISAAVKIMVAMRLICQQKRVDTVYQNFDDLWGQVDNQMQQLNDVDLSLKIEEWVPLRLDATSNINQLNSAREQLRKWCDSLGNAYITDDAEFDFKKKEIDITLSEMEASGQLQMALEYLKKNEHLIESRRAALLRNKMIRADAIQKYREKLDPELKSILKAVNETGLVEKLLDIILFEFMENGQFKPLMEVIKKYPKALEEMNPMASTMGKWAQLYFGNQLIKLTDSFPNEESGLIVNFCKSISCSSQVIRCFYVVHRAKVCFTTGGDSLIREIDDLSKKAADRLEVTMKSVRSEYLTIKKYLDQDIPRSEVVADYNVLKERILTDFEREYRYLEVASGKMESWLDNFQSDMQWVDKKNRPGAQLERLNRNIADLLEELSKNQRLMNEMRLFLEMITKKRPVDLDQMNGFWRRFDTVVGRRFQNLSRMIREYFCNYEMIIGRVNEFIDAYLAEGAGMTMREFDTIQDDLKKKYGFEWEKDAERFPVRKVEDCRNLSEMVSKLKKMIIEIDQLQNYIAKLKKNMVKHGSDLASRRVMLENKQTTEKWIHKDEMKKILERRKESKQSIIELYRNEPVVSVSGYAKKLLDEMRESGWYKNLRRSVEMITSS